MCSGGTGREGWVSPGDCGSLALVCGQAQHTPRVHTRVTAVTAPLRWHRPETSFSSEILSCSGWRGALAAPQTCCPQVCSVASREPQNSRWPTPGSPEVQACPKHGDSRQIRGGRSCPCPEIFLSKAEASCRVGHCQAGGRIMELTQVSKQTVQPACRTRLDFTSIIFQNPLNLRDGYLDLANYRHLQLVHEACCGTSVRWTWSHATDRVVDHFSECVTCTFELTRIPVAASLGLWFSVTPQTLWLCTRLWDFAKYKLVSLVQ